MSDFFTIVPGGHASPFILHVPHSSRTIPADVRAGMCATDAQLAAELDEITDTATDLIAERTAAATVELHAVEPRADDASPATGRPTPWIFRNDLSRLVIDPERFPDDREELNAVGRGAVYMKLCDGSDLRDPATFRPADMDALMDRFYHPYAAAMTSLTRDRLDATGGAFIIDVHSYPARRSAYELHDGPRPEICLGIYHPEGADGPAGTDTRGASVGKRESEMAEKAERAALRRLENLATTVFERAGFDVGVNTPFAGTYIPLEFVANPRVGGIMIEVRKDVYFDAGEGADKGGEYPANGVSHGARRPNHGAIERIAGCIAEMIGRLGR